FDEYWTGFERLFARTDAIAIGEPLVRAFAGLPPRHGGCGVATVRVTPRATVQPCVYWPGGGAPLDVLLDLGGEITTTPPFAAALFGQCETVSGSVTWAVSDAYIWRSSASAFSISACWRLSSSICSRHFSRLSCRPLWSAWPSFAATICLISPSMKPSFLPLR